jgi:uracil DNA glycosylase
MQAQKLKYDRGDAAGLVFVLWGGYAKKLKKLVQKCQNEHAKNVPIRFVEANHPAVESFHKTKTFTLIDEELSALGLGSIDWLPSRGSAAKKRAVHTD